MLNSPNLCYEVWTSEPQKVSEIVEGLDTLGDIEKSKTSLERAAALFRKEGNQIQIAAV